MDNDKLLEMPFDQYQRYRAAAEAIRIIKKGTGKKKLQILDVGGYFKNSEGQDTFPFKEFLPEEELFVLDVVECHLPHYVQGDGGNIPFPPKTFDVVNCQDVLEHIKPKQRKKFLASLLKAAENFVIIGAPFKTENSVLAEKILYEFILKTLKGKHKELEEHLKSGLPERDDVESFLNKKKVSYCDFPGGYLNNWLSLMIVKHYILTLPDSQKLAALIDRFYNRNFYESDQRPPAYRHMFVISTQKGNEQILKEISDRFQDYRDKFKNLTVEKSDFSNIQALLSLEALRDKNQIEQLNNTVRDQDIHLRNYKDEVYEKKIHIMNLEKKIDDQETHLQNYKHEVDEKERLTQNLEKEVYDKEVHIRNIEENMKLILNSKVWRFADFFRRLFYMKILKIFPPLQKSALTITREGFPSFLDKVKKREMMRKKDLYDIWIEKNSLDEKKIQTIKEEIAQFSYKPKISIIMPVYDVEKIWLEKALASVSKQLYENWELCIVDDASTKKHIKEILTKYERNEKFKIKFMKKNKGISGASNEALSLATGEFVGFLDNDDELSPDALYENVKLLNLHPEADLIYSDEDKINPKGGRIDPFFKPDWSPDLFLSFNYICHFTVCRKKIIDKIKGFREGFEGSQDYDLLLRITEKTDKIHHVPKVLYHWRQVEGSTAVVHKEKITHFENTIKALKEAMDRRKISGTVEKGTHFDQFESYRVRRTIKDSPLVSIIIPMKDMVSFLQRNLKSIEAKTEYENYEIIVVDNNSQEKETHDYFESIRKKKNIRIIEYKDAFNFSKINNFAVSHAKGDHVLFLNNDIEVTTKGWLTSMLEHSVRKEVGAVGAKLVFPNNTVQHAGTVLGLGGVAGHSHKHIPVESDGYFGALNTIRNYSAVTAACMLTKKKIFEEVGRFDESHLSVAFNDVDLCMKMREKGYLVVYTPYAVLRHYESSSRGYDLNPDEILFMKNKWGKTLMSDPYYNPNLTFDSEDFRIKIN
ncbi:MAG: glycosyltransferase [Candidatus Aminicenantes bacterium]|nr:MAG: glycosyltransferase [Candidatus Aminicenantes bacterium]